MRLIFLADVRDALGPYLAVYLLTEREWDAASIGVVMSVATVAGIVAQTPVGALVDATKAKRTLMGAAAGLVTAASLIVPWLSSFWSVAISQAIAHVAGVFGYGAFTKRKALITLAMLALRALRGFWLIFGDRR
jgi:sugar phosphate permease